VIQTQPGRIAFSVSDVAPATAPLAEAPAIEAITTFLGGPVESCSRYHGRLVANVRSHPLIGALHVAFNDHRPVCLSPDIVWLTLAQGFAHHVNTYAAELRPLLVEHQGKLKLKVRRDDFVKGSPENPWADVFAEFSAQIRSHIGDETHALIVADFSTTGPVERAASEIVLMDTVQKFFEFEVHTLCGIPTIALEGTPQDWQNIADRAEQFAPFGLDWWVEALRPVLAEFVAAAEGDPDPTFWESIYKWQGPRGSGSPYVSGWVRNLFPYLANPRARYRQPGGRPEPPLHRNRWIGEGEHSGPGRDDFPATPGAAPFRWVFLDRTFEMEFVGGLIGLTQDAETLCLRPEIGWAVRPA
jgi:hypothetical protein